MGKRGRQSRETGGVHGEDYTDEQVRYLLAVDRARVRLRRPLSVCEYLQVAKDLGYHQDHEVAPGSTNVAKVTHRLPRVKKAVQKRRKERK